MAKIKKWLSLLCLALIITAIVVETNKPGTLPAALQEYLGFEVTQPTSSHGSLTWLPSDPTSIIGADGQTITGTDVTVSMPDGFDFEALPEWDGYTPYVTVNNNTPFFTELTTEEFEIYSPLDNWGRCGVAFANISPYTQPTEKREEIGSVKPSGWRSVRYDGIDGAYLYNRCHLIGFQLAGENANKYNLITGTRWLNIEGMLLFENRINNYVNRTGNHVMYRVTPIFMDNELVARGLLMEAMSVEDQGAGVQFCVYAYNEQPGVVIDHMTGDSVGPEYKGAA